MDEVQVPIEFTVPEHISPLYSTNLVVQFTGREYILSFFFADLPIGHGDADEQHQHQRGD